MNNFLVRTITGALFVVVMLGGIWWNFWSLSALFALIIVLSLWEFYSLLEKNGSSPQKFTGILLAVFLFSGLSYFNYQYGRQGALPFCAFILAFPPFIFFIELFRKKEQPFVNIALTLLGVIYIAVPFMLLSLVVYRLQPDGKGWFEEKFIPYPVLAFFLLVWTNDTFAYLTGRLLGRTKFFERISPKKTWEGTIGGVIFTQVAAWGISFYFKDVWAGHWLIIGAIVSVTATLGDLAESLFKRSIHIKDSGGILPGHGGLLDRFDGVLLSAPFVSIYLLLIS